MSLNKENTKSIIESFYKDCLKFWRSENEENPVFLAIKYVSNLKYNPFIPNGQLLNKQSLEDWIKEKKNEKNICG